MRGSMRQCVTLATSIAAPRWLLRTHQRQAPLLCTQLLRYTVRLTCSRERWPTLQTRSLTRRPQGKRHRPHNYFGYCFTKSWVNGFVTAFGRPAQALCLTPSFLACKTKYSHGLWSGVASRPLTNCFIYRIAAFGRVNCSLLPNVLLSERARCRHRLFAECSVTSSGRLFRVSARPLVD